MDIYSQVFSCGDTTVFAKHLFSALVHQRQAVASGRMSNIFLIGRVADPVTEVNFKDFLIALSRVIRGNQDEKIKWLFNFYDANRDGRITIDVRSLSIYLTSFQKLLLYFSRRFQVLLDACMT